MKRLTATIVCILLVCFCASAQMDCFGIIAGCKATVDGTVMMGHNEDESGTQMPNVYNVPAGKDHCSYLWFEFPGLACADSYLNEYGVCLASDACPSKEDVQTGELVYEIRTAVARNARSAKEGVMMIGRMVEEKGYKDSGRSYLIADQKEGWLCSVVRGKHWVAQRVPDDMVMIIPNHYVIDRVDLTDTLNFLGSADLVEYAVSRSWYDPAKDGEFSFFKAYSKPSSLTSDHNRARMEVAGRMLHLPMSAKTCFSYVPSRKIRKANIVDALVEPPVFNDRTCLSTIFVLNGKYSPKGGCIAYCAFMDQIHDHKYTPLTLGTGLAESYHRFSTAEEALQKHFSDAEDLRSRYPGHFFWHIIDKEEDLKVNSPDYVTFVPEGDGDTYNDHFQVIFDQQRELYYAFWTQASIEGCEDQHIAFSSSSDYGKSWSKPVILAGSPSRKYATLIASWQMPMLSRSGRLYCLWNQQTTSEKPLCGMMFGRYSDDGGQTWSIPKMVPFSRRMDMDPEDTSVPPSWCCWQRPLRLGEGGKFLVACSRHGKAPYDELNGCKVEFWQFENIDDNPEVQDISISFFMTDRESFDASRVVTEPGAPETGYVPADGPAVEEASIVALPDGRLFTVMRSSLGHPLWSQSLDGGRTWSDPEILRDRDGGTAFLHPRSPCPMYDMNGPEAASGEYFMLIHNTYDFDNLLTSYQNRGPLYMIKGEFRPDAHQPVWFSSPEMFSPREGFNAFYSSYTFANGKGILWFNDYKFYLMGKEVK